MASKVGFRGILLLLAMLAPAAWFFGPAFLRGDSFVFRDAAHYYYPSFYWQREEWRAGRMPLWNPLEACGTNVAGDASACVFYPLKIVFALPLSFARCYVAYIALHVVLAAMGTWLVARVWNIEPCGAAAGAIAYAYGGSVLFQYCNVVFLVGAAWLPFAVLAADRMLVRRRLKWAIAFGAALALMTLGGDPQMAYNAGLCAGIYAIILWRKDRRLAPSPWRGQPLRKTEFIPLFLKQAKRNKFRISRAFVAVGSALNDVRRARPVLLALAGLAAFTLAAVQIVPAYESAKHSRRAAYTAPRSIYEAALSRRTYGEIAGAFVREPAEGEHAEQIYQFSVGPWRWPEFLIPNLGGRQFPENRRWMSAIAGEGRIWSPTLYLGLAPFLAMLVAATRAFRREGEARQRWLALVAVLGVAASLGGYGANWLIGQFYPNEMGGPVGGLYWLLVVALPGYASFRYPAKLMVIAAMAMSLLAARGWRTLTTGENRWSRSAPWIVLAIAAISATLLSAFRGPWEAWLAEAPADNLFGPLDTSGATRDLFWSLAHSAIAALALVAVQWLSRLRSHGACESAAVFILAFELIVAHNWLMPSAPEALWTERSPLEDRLILDSQDEENPPRYFRVASPNWIPPGFKTTTSPDRQRDGLRRDRETLFPRYGILAGGAAVAPRDSTEDSLYSELFRADPYRTIGSPAPHQHWLDALATRFVLSPRSSNCADMELLWRGGDVSLWKNPRVFPLAWPVRHGEVVESCAGNDLRSQRRLVSRILFLDNPRRPRDFRQTAVIESQSPAATTGVIEEVNNRVTVVARDPRRVELRASVIQACWVILAERYDGAWIAESRELSRRAWTPRAICRANGALRAVYLPAGEHQLVFRFHPVKLYAAGAISAAAWLLAFLTAAISIARRHRLSFFILHTPFSIRFLRRRRPSGMEN